MARRRKGNPVDGWIVVDKPLGVTSSAVVNKVRWVLKAQKAGHSGTLDPLASGCLAVALGEATKTIPIAQEGDKLYRFHVRWGEARATDDAEGEVVRTSALRPSQADILALLPAFLGVVQQVPPAFSAIKVDGARAYDLARSGEEVALAARDIRIERLELVEMLSDDEAAFEMVCGKGGYVRSVARDLGEKLGCLGYVSLLRRLGTGPFDLGGAVEVAGLDDLEAMGEAGLLARMLPVEAGFGDLRCLCLGARSVDDVRMGRQVLLNDAVEPGLAWVSERETGKAVALGEVVGGAFQPKRVISAAG